MGFVYIKTFDNVRMIQRTQNFYFILQHLHTGSRVVFSIDHLDRTVDFTSCMNSSIYHTTKTLPYLFTCVINISPYSFLVSKKSWSRLNYFPS